MSQDKGQAYLEAFQLWAASTTDDEFAQIVNAKLGQLTRSEVRKLSGVSAESMKRGKVKTALAELEDQLRARGVLPPLTEAGEKAKSEPKLYDQKHNNDIYEKRRKSQLEAENHDLRAQVAALEQEVLMLKKQLSNSAETLEAINDLQVFRRCPTSQ